MKVEFKTKAILLRADLAKHARLQGECHAASEDVFRRTLELSHGPVGVVLRGV